MGQVLTILSRVFQALNLISAISKIIAKLRPAKPEIVPTKTDKLVSAIDLADRIEADMEQVGMILATIPESERGETVQKIFESWGLPSETWDQMNTWNNNARFGWSSFRDELRIIFRERLTVEQQKDRNVKDQKNPINKG